MIGGNGVLDPQWIVWDACQLGRETAAEQHGNPAGSPVPRSLPLPSTSNLKITSSSQHLPRFNHMASKKTQQVLAEFVAERDWDQFHTPENLAKSIAIEAAELLECFQWGAEPADATNVRHELADVLTYCLHLARRIGVDPDEIVLEKLEITRKKYPVEKAKGSSKKLE